MSQPITPRIYVADLAAYNAGRLHGVWIDATQDVEAMPMAVIAISIPSTDTAIVPFIYKTSQLFRAGFGGHQ